MSPITFEIGNKYENMKGIYEVLSIHDNVMRIQWENGEVATTSVAMQRRIIERLEQEREEKENKASKKRKSAKTKETNKKTGKPKPQSDKKGSAQDAGGIKKKYLKTRKICKVTFVLPQTVAGHAKRACIVGDFNDWNDTATPMKKTKTKGFTVTLELEPERDYQFRYLVDGSKWENDQHADKYVKSPFGDAENSVVSV